jgi:hypothetical protein
VLFIIASRYLDALLAVSLPSRSPAVNSKVDWLTEFPETHPVRSSERFQAAADKCAKDTLRYPGLHFNH